MKGLFAGLLFLLMLFLSCRRANPLPLHSFKWTFDNVTYTAGVDSSGTGSPTPGGGPYIMAGTGATYATSGSSIYMLVGALSVGTHNFDTTTNRLYPLGLEYKDPSGKTFFTGNGSLVVTANANKVFSGQFSAVITVSPGVTKPLTGEFTNARIY